MCGRWADTPSNLVIESHMVRGGDEYIRPWKLRLNLVRRYDWKHKQKISSYLKLKVRIVIFKQSHLLPFSLNTVWFDRFSKTRSLILWS